MGLVPAETIMQFSQPGVDTSITEYLLTFRNGTTQVRIGSGNVDQPVIGGRTEPVTIGERSGQLTIGAQVFSLVMEANDRPTFVAAPVDRRLPLVHQGRIVVVTENLSRADFDQLIANVVPIPSQEFVARAGGQFVGDITYLWPGVLSDGFTVDLTTVRTSWEDYLLQGGRPFFTITATGPEHQAVTIRGGGDAFVVPEGPDIEQRPARVHDRGATVVSTPDGTVVFWSENATFYTVSSSDLPEDELVRIAEGLEQIDAADILQRSSGLNAAPKTAATETP